MKSVIQDIQQLVATTPNVGAASLRTRLSRVSPSASHEDDDSTYIAFLETSILKVKELVATMDKESHQILPQSKSTQLMVLSLLDLEQTNSVCSLVELICIWAIHPSLEFRIPEAARGEQFSLVSNSLPPSTRDKIKALPDLSFRAVSSVVPLIFSHDLSVVTWNRSWMELLPYMLTHAFLPSQHPQLSSNQINWIKEMVNKIIQSPIIAVQSLAKSMMFLLSLKPPAAITSVLSSSLTSLLHERKNGVMGILSVLLDAKNTDVDLAQMQAAARSISVIPSRFKNPADYMQKVIPQLLNILRGSRTAATEKYILTSCEVFSSWSTSFPALTFTHWVLPAMSPLAPFIYSFAQNVYTSRFAQIDTSKMHKQDTGSSQIINNPRRKAFIIQDLSLDSTESDKINESENQELSPSVQAASSPDPNPSENTDQDGFTSSRFAEFLDMEAWKQCYERGWTGENALSLSSGSKLNANSIAVNHRVLMGTLSTLHLMTSSCGNNEFMHYMTPIVPSLLELLSLSKNSKTLNASTQQALVTSTSYIIQRFFAISPHSLSLKLILHLIFDWTEEVALQNPNKSSESHPNGELVLFQFQAVHDGIQVISKTDDKLTANHGESEVEESALQVSNRIHLVASLLALISQTTDNSHPSSSKTLNTNHSGSSYTSITSNDDSKSSEIAGILFVHLLELLVVDSHLTKSLESQEPEKTWPASFIDRRLDMLSLASERQFVTINALMVLLETLGASVLHNPIQICLFIKNMISHSEDEELLILVFGILQQILEAKLLSKEDADILLCDLLTPTKVACDHSSPIVSSCANESYRLMMQYLSDAKPNFHESDPPPERSPPVANTKKRRWVLDPKVEDVNAALQFISSPIVAIRAGGLIQLRRFVLLENPEAMSQLPLILEHFTKNLSDNDSYVYLGAIQGLSAIADVAFDLAIPVLREQYISSKRSMELRLNVGESILQVCRRWADALPKYARPIVELLLSCAQSDPQALMRASALSNLGEVCELMRFGLLPYIEEIVAMLYDVLQVEEDPHVRRAAVHLVKQLFKGLSKDIFVVASSHLSRISQILERIEATDQDLILRQHASNALQLYQDAKEAAVKSQVDQMYAFPFLEVSDSLASLKIVKDSI